MLLTPILLTATAACSYGSQATSYVNANGWININLLVVLLVFMVGAIIYGVSGLLPHETREKMRGAARYEIVQGVISIFIILALIIFASLTCYTGAGLLPQYTGTPTTSSSLYYNGPYQTAETYVSNLLFAKGLAIQVQLYSAGVSLAVEGETVDSLLALAQLIKVPKPPLTKGPITIQYEQDPMLSAVYVSYATVFTESFASLIIVSFGSLFLIFLMLFIIYSISLTVVVPIAIVMRSIPFAGPKLREAADSFMAIAIGFYFILPLMLVFNYYMVGWIYCSNGVNPPLCNPDTTYVGTYSIGNIPTSSLFSSSSVNVGGAIGSAPTNVFGLVGSSGVDLQNLINAPSQAAAFAVEIGQYMFQATVLVAVDFAVALGFAMGLTKGLQAISSFVSSGPIFGA